jgi:hypothetical protein
MTGRERHWPKHTKLAYRAPVDPVVMRGHPAERLIGCCSSVGFVRFVVCKYTTVANIFYAVQLPTFSRLPPRLALYCCGFDFA